MSERNICPHCGKRTPGGMRYTQHVDACTHGPVGEEVRRWLVSHATEGRICSVEYYKRNRPGHFPNYLRLMEEQGRWDDVASWCGLVYAPGQRPRYSEEMPEVEFVLPDPAPFGLNAFGWTTRTIYDWRTRQHITMEVAQLR